MVDGTTRLLGLGGLAVTNVAGGRQDVVVYVVTADEQAQRCPQCGTRARRWKGWRVTRPRDLAVGGRRPKLVWGKRRWRWRCDHRECEPQSLTEAVAAVPARKRLANQYRICPKCVVDHTWQNPNRIPPVQWPVVTFDAVQSRTRCGVDTSPAGRLGTRSDEVIS